MNYFDNVTLLKVALQCTSLGVYVLWKSSVVVIGFSDEKILQSENGIFRFNYEKRVFDKIIVV